MAAMEGEEEEDEYMLTYSVSSFSHQHQHHNSDIVESKSLRENSKEQEPSLEGEIDNLYEHLHALQRGRNSKLFSL
ncbi:hypothetical protein PanWU01x14_277360 [Parasponia andersonii]|uniref:Uncharacterized protein n=1 Tax=Parasponia andersonii TaxID=3476 RepID=A0A2P5B2Q7_PARAD|nr:hypothetical protein PanWU01x14_277360 [Parasponia andersonii]